MSEPSIRFAVANDAATIHGFICGLAAYEREPDAVKVTVDDLKQQLDSERPPFECLLADQDGEARGIALFFHNYSTWRGRRGIFLEDLYVPPEHRGRGIGFALLRRLGQIALERGCARVEWQVLDWNQPAIDFYEALGAKAMSEWRLFRLTDDPLRRLGA